MKNLEDRKGKPGRYLIDEPMPEDVVVLPTVEEVLQALQRCTVAAETYTPLTLRRSGDGFLMHLGDLLYEISTRGITLTCGHTEDRLNAKPTAALTPELIKEIKNHKNELIQVVREDEEMRRTGIIQSERQVFDLTREFFGADDRQGAS